MSSMTAIKQGSDSVGCATPDVIPVALLVFGAGLAVIAVIGAAIVFVVNRMRIW